MPQIRLTQATCLKHFDRVNDKRPANSPDWIDAARENHQERQSGYSATTNTLVILTPQAWDQIVAGTFPFTVPALLNEVEITVPAAAIERIITTTKAEEIQPGQGMEHAYGIDHDLTGNAVRPVRFLCRRNAAPQQYDIVHFDGLM